MNEMAAAGARALELLIELDPDLVEIVVRSLYVSLSAVALAAVIGLPLGALLALARFPGRRVVLVTVNALMGLPPVVAGLVLYLLLSRSGPFGVFGLLFTPTAMIIAQAVLVTPIIAALTRQTVQDLWTEYREQLGSLGATPLRAVPTLLWDGRVALFTALLAGFGRASAEVGAVMIVGGNIDHVTRVMTTTIALETARGDLPLALALGIVLLLMALAVNIAAFLAQERAARSQNA
ncbi:ABC transporter permease [Caenispirillum bisanense]|uniref:Tungstate transport system permease protein n=1 Tax=Caenispirillum bisanense TaxID=414052 RepID=A0A286G5Y7_9PROT|nr:ABC transporter permease [Caenispirillum bisanense]SOD90913.1 tungstate transport system permease protein [Caenispirillum bisanense]